MRQHENLLICAVNDLASGHVTANTLAFMGSLNRPLSINPQNVVRLCSLNAEVALHNAHMMEEVRSKQCTYMADDNGEDKYLLKMQVEKVKM